MAHHHRHHNHHKPKEKKSNFSRNVKWFFIWFVIYGVLIGIFELIRNKYNLFDKPVAHFLILGLFLLVLSRFIYSAIRKKRFSLKGIIAWTIIYAFLLFLIDFLLNEFMKIDNQYSQYITLILTSVIFTILVMFLRRASLKSIGIRKPRLLRAPSQIFTGIVLLILGILCFRFSGMVFLDWFGWTEGLAWSWLIGLALIIAGFLVLVAWWRNNVLQHRIGIKFGHWK